NGPGPWGPGNPRSLAVEVEEQIVCVDHTSLLRKAAEVLSCVCVVQVDDVVIVPPQAADELRLKSRVVVVGDRWRLSAERYLRQDIQIEAERPILDVRYGQDPLTEPAKGLKWCRGLPRSVQRSDHGDVEPLCKRLRDLERTNAAAIREGMRQR